MKEIKELIHQPEPVGDGVVVADKVHYFIDERVNQQLLRYGTKLRTNNGRDALYDALQEAVDTVFYITQAIIERDSL